MIDRLIVSRGPAMVTFRGGVFFSREDIVVELNKETKGIPSSAFGELTQVNQGIKASLKFRPVGEFEHLAVLFPYALAKVGSSIFGDADYPLLIQPLDTTQNQTRFKAAGLSKMPDLNFTATDTLLGDAEFQMIGANNTAPDAAGRIFVQEANTIDVDALPYSDAALIVQAYLCKWGEVAPWNAFETREGMKVAFAMTLTEDQGDAIGHYDTIFGGLTVVATGLPQGITEAQMIAAAQLQGASAVRGTRLGVGAADLDIFADGVFFRMYAANIRKAGQVFGSTKQRIPDLEWVASRTIADGGGLNPLFFIGTEEPA